MVLMKVIITVAVVILGLWIKPLDRWVLKRNYYKAKGARKRGEVQ